MRRKPRYTVWGGWCVRARSGRAARLSMLLVLLLASSPAFASKVLLTGTSYRLREGRQEGSQDLVTPWPAQWTTGTYAFQMNTEVGVCVVADPGENILRWRLTEARLASLWSAGYYWTLGASEWKQPGASEPQGINPTADLLKSLTYGDNIPGFRQVNTERNHSGPLIVVHDPAGGAPATGYIRSLWQSGDTLNELEITVRVCETPDATLLALRRRTSAILVQDPIEQQIGDESWARVGLEYGSLKFVIGRVAVSLIMYPANRRSPGGEPVVSQMDGRLDEVIRPLARGPEWVIRQHPDMLAETAEGQQRTVMAADKPLAAPALTFGSVAWASLDAFRQAGAQVAWDAKSGKATVSYGGRTVELTALRRHARLNGEGFDLGAGVMVDRSGPVVPLRKVAEALGMKGKITKTTIELG